MNKEKLKGLLIGVIITAVVMSSAPLLARVAQQTITVNFNNIQIAVDGTLIHTEYEPFIFEGRTYLPVSDLAYAMGFDTTWENATNTVHLTSRSNVVPNYPAHVQNQTPQVIPQTASGSGISIPANITPRPAARAGGPTNPAISAQRAVELATAHLISIGITNAQFDYMYMDFENGTWVWSIEFDGQGGSFEFYVNVDTGTFLKSPQAVAGNPQASPNPSPRATSSPSPSPRATGR